jgi:predicted nucleic acid-binding protein
VIVVSNTSPLNYLVLLNKEYVLASLFQTVAAPPAVAAELARSEAPEAVRKWIARPPPWLRIQAPRVVDSSIDLDSGEREAIALAQEIRADRILLDEAKARRIAASRGLKVAGTLAILFEAHQRGLLDFERVVADLANTTFYLDENLIRTLLGRIGSK